MNAAQHILVFCVQLYRWVLSPAQTFLFGPLGRCRFTPSCSEYALEAIRLHGAWAGTFLAMKRVCRCHPWGACGQDTVPGPKRGQFLQVSNGARTALSACWRRQFNFARTRLSALRFRNR